MKTETHLSFVQTRHWAPDDDYQVVEVQVDMPAHTNVRVTVTAITDEEYKAYCRGEVDSQGNKI